MSAKLQRTVGEVHGDAYAGQTFTGTVSQVRLEPKTEQNVVTLHRRDRCIAESRSEASNPS
jgi:hypothetical protein